MPVSMSARTTFLGISSGIASLCLLSGPSPYVVSTVFAADDTIAIAATTEPVEGKTLTAADVLKSDLEPKIAYLKDVDFVFKLLPDYINKADYASIRTSLRSYPAADLRKTCKKLGKYLPATQAVEFNKAYNVMIEAVDDFDVMAFKRIQGDDVPDTGKEDTKLMQKMDLLQKRFDAMLATLQ
eukprot:CAMPEP_0174960788 /NCGR_PEP_ID=MMETSP0004_2-20121128/3889_1 /TAXON_ID=420556 /ORGANISM="Ochromonas sp., Strain CCMP1393" /LENGTH=182 /DNA_ID=CAMNT_0016209181 /DNA_START=82 /DNA_END=630 /DNA_ORIENTATION=+